MTKLADERPEVGKHVTVYWGLDEVDGVVTDVYGSGALARARVKVSIRGAAGEELGTEEFSLPFGVIKPV